MSWLKDLFGTSKQTTTQTQGIPEWVEDAARRNYQTAEQVAAGQWPDNLGRPVQYAGTRVAGLTPMEQAARDRISGMSSAPYVSEAISGTRSATQRYGGSFGADASDLDLIRRGGERNPTQFGVRGAAEGAIMASGMPTDSGARGVAIGAGQRFADSDYQSFMNPYMESVFSAMNRQGDRDINNIRAQAAKGKAFGGSRQAVAEELARDRVSRQIGETAASAFNNAQGQFNTENNRGLQIAQLLEGINNAGADRLFRSGSTLGSLDLQTQGLQSGQFNQDRTAAMGAGSTLAGLDLQTQGLDAGQFNTDMARILTAAGQMGQLGQSQFGMDTGLAQLLASFGVQDRAIKQAGADAEYGDFLEARDYPIRMQQYLQSVLSGTPFERTTTTTAPGSSAATQLLGGAATVAGIGGPRGFDIWRR
jgi:hypothetical protein